MSDSGFSYVGLIQNVAQVETRNGPIAGLYNITCKGYGPNQGDDRKLSANSHAKAEQGGQLNPYWQLITSNMGTGVPVQFKGWANQKEDEWGGAPRVYWNVNGARLWQDNGQGQQAGPPAQPPVQPAQQGGAPPAQRPTGPAARPDPMVPATMAVATAASWLESAMVPELTDAPPAVRGAYIRQTAAKLLHLADLVVRGDLGAPWEQQLRNTTWKDAEEPSAPQASPEEPQPAPEPEQPAQEPISDWGQPQAPGSTGW